MATAKIQYTAKIENVPREVAWHLGRTSALLESLLDQLKKVDPVTQDPVISANQVQSIRSELAVLDLNLDDCYSILTGYANYKASLLKPAQQEKTADDATGGD